MPGNTPTQKSLHLMHLGEVKKAMNMKCPMNKSCGSGDTAEKGGCEIQDFFFHNAEVLLYFFSEMKRKIFKLYDVLKV